MSKLVGLHKFDHWSEVLSVLSYAKGSQFEFVHHKRGVDYVDPLGSVYRCQIKSHFSRDDTFISNGAIHLETHPLSQGKIPYSYFPHKIIMQHTTGYSPWDFTQLVDLAAISAAKPGTKEYEDAQGSKVLYAMNKKHYDRFMNTDWISFNKLYYEEYKSKINDLVSEGFIVPVPIEPAQFWLDKIQSRVQKGTLDKSDNICIEINWCNMKKASYAKIILDKCKALHDYTGKDIDIRLHSYTSKSFLKYFEPYSYIHLYPYESISKYDVMDRYNLYFVDGTGLGYETAYRRSFDDKKPSIFYLSGLPSDEPLQGFDGIVQMNAVPKFTDVDFLNGQSESYFSNSVLKESFPHMRGQVEEECFKIISDLSHKVKLLD